VKAVAGSLAATVLILRSLLKSPGTMPRLGRLGSGGQLSGRPGIGLHRSPGAVSLAVLVGLESGLLSNAARTADNMADAAFDRID
jgi:hypothetical protein